MSEREFVLLDEHVQHKTLQISATLTLKHRRDCYEIHFTDAGTLMLRASSLAEFSWKPIIYVAGELI